MFQRASLSIQLGTIRSPRQPRLDNEEDPTSHHQATGRLYRGRRYEAYIGGCLATTRAEYESCRTGTVTSKAT